MTAITCRPRWDLLALLLVGLLVNLPLLADPAFLPQHDTFLHTMVLHHAYSHLYFHGALAHWFPNVSYGVPTLLWNAAVFTPSDYGGMLLGWALGVQDVVLLQKLAILCDQLVFVSGMYALGRRWFQQRVSVVLVCLAAAAMPVWYANVGHTLRIFYLYPFFLLTLWHFYQTRQPLYFWSTGGLVFLALIGNAQYAVALYLLSLSTFLLVLVCQEPALLRGLAAPSVANALGFLGCAALAGVFWAISHFSRVHLDIITPGRNPDGSTSLESFLRFDGFDGFIPIAIYVLGAPIFTELNLYVGLLAWAMLLWAVIHVRSVGFAAAAVPLFVLFGIAFSDTIATLFYYVFPLIHYFKPIQYVLSVANIHLLLCAGFGLDSFLQANRTRQCYFGAGCVVFACLLGTQLAPQADLLTARHFHLAIAAASSWGNSIWFWLRLATYALGLAVLFCCGTRLAEANLRRLTAVVLVVCLTVDLGLYRFLAAWPDERQVFPEADCARVRPLQYIPERSSAFYFKRLPAPPSSIYDIQHQFEEVDPGVPQNRSLVFPSSVRALLAARQVPDVPKGYYYVDRHWREVMLKTQLGLVLADQPLAHVLGCDTPKLRVYDAARWAAGEEAQRLVGTIPDIDRVVVLSGPEGSGQAMADGTGAANGTGAATGTVTVEQFNANKLVVTIAAPDAAPRWLVYADAYHPGWSVRLNGRPAPLLQANLGFKAVQLEPGTNRIEWRFHGIWAWLNNALLLIGAVAFYLGMLGILVYFCNPGPRHVASEVTAFAAEPPRHSGGPSATP